MKRKELEKVRTLPPMELKKRIAEEREKLQTMWFDLSLGKVSNVKDVKATKRTIAQLLTIVRNHAQ